FALVKTNRVPELAAHYDAQGAFPLMVKYLLPAGLRGVVVAGLLSALMGSLAGVFNGCSALFTVDIYPKRRPAASPETLLTLAPPITRGLLRAGVVPVHRGPHGPQQHPPPPQGSPPPADLCRLLLRRVLETPQCRRLLLGDDRRLPAWRLPHARGHAGDDEAV